MKKSIVLNVKSIKCKNSKISYIFNEKLVLSIVCSKFGNNSDRIFKQDTKIEILKMLGIVVNINKYFKYF